MLHAQHARTFHPRESRSIYKDGDSVWNTKGASERLYQPDQLDLFPPLGRALLYGLRRSSMA